MYFIKRHMRFLVNFAKFLKTPILIEHLRWLPEKQVLLKPIELQAKKQQNWKSLQEMISRRTKSLSQNNKLTKP